jgi:hypothetical protein
LYVWQGKDLRTRFPDVWQRKDLRTGFATETRRAQRRRSLDIPTPHPVFCEKRLQVIENKGRRHGKEGKEIPRGGKLLKAKG